MMVEDYFANPLGAQCKVGKNIGFVKFDEAVCNGASGKKNRNQKAKWRRLCLNLYVSCGTGY
jgi:hypothetical protein